MSALPNTRDASADAHRHRHGGEPARLGGAGSTRSVRVLLPVSANAESQWGVDYALRVHREGRLLEAVVLNVGAPVNEWQAMQFRTQHEIGVSQSRQAQSCIDAVIRRLAGENVPCRGVFRQGDVVFSILDAAEEFECDEIVMPRPRRKGWGGLWGRPLVLDMLERRRGIPVILVDSSGEPG